MTVGHILRQYIPKVCTQYTYRRYVYCIIAQLLYYKIAQLSYIHKRSLCIESIVDTLLRLAIASLIPVLRTGIIQVSSIPVYNTEQSSVLQMSVAHLIMSVANNGEQAQYKSAAILLLAWNSSIPYQRALLSQTISLAQDKAVTPVAINLLQNGAIQPWPWLYLKLWNTAKYRASALLGAALSTFILFSFRAVLCLQL